MTRIHAVLLSTWFLGHVLLGFAGEPRLEPIPKPLPVKLPRDLPLDEVLKELEAQTGNPVIDRRTLPRDNPRLTLNTRTFWQALDAIGEQKGIRYFFNPADNTVALVDDSYRKLVTHHGGPFRLAIKQVSVTSNLETQARYADVAFDVAWEPRFYPLFINLEKATVEFGNKKEKLPGEAMRGVADLLVKPIELRMPAPPRSALVLDALTGEFRVVAAPKLLEFSFEQLGPISEKKPREARPQEGVQVSVTEVKQTAKRWSIEVLIANPAGSIIDLESFRADKWMNNNRMWLSWQDPATRKIRMLEPNPLSEDREGTRREMRHRYDFEPRDGTPLPPAGASVTLHYRTPNRVAAFIVPFEFRNLPLP